MLKLTEEQLDWLAERIPDHECSPKGGRPPADKRKVIQGMFWILDNGAKWKDLPRKFGSKSTVHRWFQAWTRAGVFEDIMRDAGQCIEERDGYSCCTLLGGVVVFEHEFHNVSPGIHGADAALERAHEISDAHEEDVGQGRSFEMAPESFNQVQVRTVRGQPMDFDASTMAVQPVLHGAGMVITRVVAHEPNPAARVGPQKQSQEGNEVEPALVSEIIVVILPEA